MNYYYELLQDDKDFATDLEVLSNLNSFGIFTATAISISLVCLGGAFSWT